MSEPTLSTLSRQEVAKVLSDSSHLLLHERREYLYRWALSVGSNMSLVEAVLSAESSYSDDLKELVAFEKKAWAAKLKKDEDDIARLKKEGRWDSVHNCEIPLLNSDDPKERRFGHNAGSDKSADVTWDSHTSTHQPADVKPTKKKEPSAVPA